VSPNTTVEEMAGVFPLAIRDAIYRAIAWFPIDLSTNPGSRDPGPLRWGCSHYPES